MSEVDKSEEQPQEITFLKAIYEKLDTISDLLELITLFIFVLLILKCCGQIRRREK